MNKRYCGILMALGCLVLAGCAAPPAAIDAAGAVARLRTGEPLLSCREACVAAWRTAQPQAAQLVAARRWADLALLLQRIAYQDDLSLYYLGQAAEGLGYPGAAASYYRQSTYLTGTTIACRNLSGTCGGHVFPQAAVARLAMIQRGLVYRLRPRRSAPSPHGREAPPPGEAEIAVPPPAEAAGPTPAAMPTGPPAEAQTLPPPPPPAATPAPGRSPTSDYIEPPPAIR